jgi:hypothetical protein
MKAILILGFVLICIILIIDVDMLTKENEKLKSKIEALLNLMEMEFFGD